MLAGCSDHDVKHLMSVVFISSLFVSRILSSELTEPVVCGSGVRDGQAEGLPIGTRSLVARPRSGGRGPMSVAGLAHDRPTRTVCRDESLTVRDIGVRHSPSNWPTAAAS